MIKIYIRKITEKAINPVTGEVWKIEDVPEHWRAAVREALENGGNE